MCTAIYYDEHGRRSAAKDPLGNLTEYGYDGQGRLITTTRYLDGEPVVTLNHYDALSNRVGQSDALGHTTTYVYDDLNRLAATLSAEGVATVRGYDELGRVVTTTNGLGHQTFSEYDILGWVVAVTDAENKVTHYAYDALGNQVAITDANGVRTSYLYDGLNRLVAVIENDTGGAFTHDSNVLTQYVYDVLGNRVVITNALGYTSTHTTYDALNRPAVVQDALGHKTYTRYNALGYRNVVTDANGAVTRYSYDGLNRLIGVQYVDDGVTVRYSYDALGNRTTMTDTLGVTRYVYDDLYRLISVADPFTGTVRYSYDLVGNRTQLIYPNGQVVTYAHDSDNQLIQVENWDGGTTHYAYDAAGRLIGTTLPNNVASIRQYDNVNQLIALAHIAPDNTPLSSYRYELDGTGNPTRAIETLNETTYTITYTYNHLYRLTEADYSTGEQFEYTYDAIGNRLVYTATITQTTVTTYSYDAASRLVSAGGISYTWDDLGRLLDNGTYQYNWDAASRLITVTDGANIFGFRYNGDGDRLVQIANGNLTIHTIDVGLALPEALAAHSDDGTIWYLHLPSSIAMDDGFVWIYNLPDALGSVRQQLDELGQVVSVQRYRPFGAPLTGDGGTLYGFTGEWWEAKAGLLYLRARYYAPLTGWFLSEDSVPGFAKRPLTQHLWLYALDNPLRYIDPSGHQVAAPDCEPGDICATGTFGPHTPSFPPYVCEPPEAVPHYYDRQAAVEYALRYACEVNYNYYTLVQDCTNFVSQALAAGELPKTETWRGHHGPFAQLLSRLFEPSLERFDFGFPRGCGSDLWDAPCTSAWSVALDLNSYLKNVLGYKSYKLPEMVEQAQRRESPPDLSSFTIQAGDVVFYRGEDHSEFNHTALVIGWGPPTFFQNEKDPQPCSDGLPEESGLLPWIVDHGGPGYKRAYNDTGTTYEIEFVHIPDFLGEW